MRPLTERARFFRKAPTRGEARLWSVLRNRGLGVRFYRQKVVGPFIPDFVCERPKLVVEIDGPVHDDQIERDGERQAYLESLGYSVLRVSAESAERELDDVVTRIVLALSAKRDS